LKKAVNDFWDNELSSCYAQNKEGSSNHIFFIFRLMFTNNQIVSVTNLIKINISDREMLIDYLLDKLSVSNEHYTQNALSSIIFSYGIRKGEIESDLLTKTNSKLKFQTYYNNKLPIGIKPEDLGTVSNKKDNFYTIFLGKNIMLILEAFSNYNKVQYFKNNRLMYTWTDNIINREKNIFKRHLGKSVYHYQNNNLICITVQKKTRPINSIKNKLKLRLKNNIITMDIETIVVNNVHIPYLICWYDGIKSNYYNLDNISLNKEELNKQILNMIKNVINDLSQRKYKNYRIYLHNFANFDSTFLLKYFPQLGFCSPMIHNGKLISLTFTPGKSITEGKPYNLIFRDSYLLLPSSLRNLGKSFNVSNTKSFFPYLFNKIEYTGEVPDISYFPGISQEDYLNYKNSFEKSKWDFKKEAIKYCMLDCISLYQVISKFNILIFNKFNINVHNYPTLPSLSFAIFRTHYYNTNTQLNKDILNKEVNNIINDDIHMLSGSIMNDIKESYTGGSVDMFIPTNVNYPNTTPCEARATKGSIYYYDINSLYPYVMKNFEMPVGSPTYFEGDILKIDPNAFGFFYCKIITPKNLKHPILQTHIKTKDGVRTISPLGTWQGMFFSEELKNSLKYGYKFEVLWGYTFNKSYVFKDFVDNLYNLRLTYPKSDPMNYIAKILMNSLYGRFGMDDNFSTFEIFDQPSYIKYENRFKEFIKNVTNLGNHYLVEIFNKNKTLNTELDNANEIHNVNIAIASAITAYARIVMSQLKNRRDIIIYYSDTDSIIVNKPLDDIFVSQTELGKFKLEHVAKRGVFIAPKVYALELENGETIIKIKGLIKNSLNNITFDMLFSLLNKDKFVELEQEKWYKLLENANIEVLKQI